MTHPAYVLAALAERDRARATAVALEQELAEVTRERDEALAELARLRGNVGVLAEVTGGLSADREVTGSFGAQFGPPRQEPHASTPRPIRSPVMKFRKKPVVVEAMQFTPETAQAVADWCGHRAYGGATKEGPYIPIRTPEGEMLALPGDWVIKGVHGEFYPRKPDIFEATYEPVPS